jgi:hypothetical protein
MLICCGCEEKVFCDELQREKWSRKSQALKFGDHAVNSLSGSLLLVEINSIRHITIRLNNDHRLATLSGWGGICHSSAGVAVMSSVQ